MICHTVFVVSICVALTLVFGVTGSTLPPGSRTSTTSQPPLTTTIPQEPSKAQPNTTTQPSTQAPKFGDVPTETLATAELPDPDTFFAWLDSIQPAPTSNDTAQEESESESLATTKESGTAKVFAQQTTVPQGGETVETTTAAARSLKTTEDMEWLRKMFEESGAKATPETETGGGNNPVTTSAPEQNTPRKRGKFDLPPPDKFFEWLNSLHPKSNTVTESSNLDQTESETSIKVPHNDHSTHFINHLGIVLYIIVAVLGLFITVAALVLVHRLKLSKEMKETDDEQVKQVSEVYFSSSGYTDVFHGIPTNNDVWKNLDLLSTNAPSVLPDGERKVHV